MTGFYLFADKKRLLLSSLLNLATDDANLKDLEHPVLVYVASILVILGMMIITISFIGFWTTFFNNCCLLSFYFIMIMFLVLLKFFFCIVITVWPQFLGMKLNATEMVKILQGKYGVPGFEKYTVAMDFAQTLLNCCAINDSINYDTSLWRLQKFGKKELTVPLTCCVLVNKSEENSYLDPHPFNESLCQSVEPNEFQKYRHLPGCLDKIEFWYRQQYIIILCAGLILVLIEFFVLLLIVLNCTKLKQNQLSAMITSIKFNNDEQSTSQRSSERDNIYQDFVSVTPNIREVYVQSKNPSYHYC